MTIDRQHGKIIFTCDQENTARCEEALETDERDWEDAMAVFRKAGWRSFANRPAGTGFIHCCSKCLVPR